VQVSVTALFIGTEDEDEVSVVVEGDGVLARLCLARQLQT